MDVNRIDVHIDLLRVDGASAHRAAALAAELRTELARLLTADGVPASWTARTSAQQITAVVAPQASGASIGRAAARAIISGRADPQRPA